MLIWPQILIQEDQQLVTHYSWVQISLSLCQRSNIVSKSSIEVEYCRLASLVSEITWIRSPLTKLQVCTPRVPEIYFKHFTSTCNPILHAQTRHIELDLYFVCEKVQQKMVAIKHISSSDQTVVVLTKTMFDSQFSTMSL